MEEELKNRIRELEEEVENKEIMITALLNEIKKLKSKRKSPEIESTKRIKGEIESQEVSCSVESKTVDAQAKPLSSNERSRVKHQDKSLREEVDALVYHKKVSRGFGNSWFLEEVIDYCADTIPFNFGTTQLEHKGQIKAYVAQNSTRIAAMISKGINSYSLSQAYSTLYCVSGGLNPLEACVVFHDILLVIDDYSKLHFIFHSLFKNKIDGGLLGSTILSLISYQLKVDLEFHKSKKGVIQSFTSLKYSYEMPKACKRLEDLLMDMTTPINVFNNKMIDENIYQHVYSIRMLTHYLDWDYTFNTYFNEVLYPRLNESDAYLLFLGIVNFNFYRSFGSIESTKMVFDIIKSKMESVSTTSVLSYLLIKQIDPLFSELWIKENSKELVSQGWSLDYLRVYLLF